MATTFTITGQKQLQARLTAISKAPKEMLREVGLRAVAEAKTIVPRKTGNLGRTIRIGSMSDTHVEVRAGGQLNVGYAAAVEYGSRPHVILPKRAKALAWGGPRTLGGRLRSGGTPTNFARRVNHPGTRAKPYLIPAFDHALSVVGIAHIVREWNEAA
jgi:hypothetical protein